MENNDNFFRTNAVHFSFIEICAIYLGDKCSKFLWELCVCVWVVSKSRKENYGNLTSKAVDGRRSSPCPHWPMPARRQIQSNKEAILLPTFARANAMSLCERLLRQSSITSLLLLHNGKLNSPPSQSRKKMESNGHLLFSCLHRVQQEHQIFSGHCSDNRWVRQPSWMVDNVYCAITHRYDGDHFV